jgi:glycosyltransferase involved in cell wall biosynthesis
MHLVNSFREGGTERQAAQLVGLLHASGRYRALVASHSVEGGLRAELAAWGVEPVGEFPLRRFHDLKTPAQLRRFAEVLRRHRVDVLHTHDFYTNVFGMVAGVIAGVPVRIASRRELDYFTPRQRRVERWAYRAAHVVVANCDRLRERLEAEGVARGRTATLYNGVDPERVTPPPGFSPAAARRALGLPVDAGAPVVTMVANLRHERKNHGVFLEAAHRIRQSFPGAVFVLAGEGPLEGPLRERARQLGLAAHVVFTGRCDDVASLLAVSDVCVLSSETEGFSNAVLEYMAAGRPVVATDVGGTREAVVDGETGYLVPPGDPSALARPILRLLRAPELARRMGESGRRRVRSTFTAERQCEEAEALYDRLLGRTGQGTAACAGERGARV